MDDAVVAPVENQNKGSISIFAPASSAPAHMMDISSGMQLVHITPNVNESFNRPPHQIRYLSIAYLDNALNAVYPARHVHAKKWASNRLRAVGHGFGNGHARLGGIRRPVQNEVPPLGPRYKVLNATDAKATFDETPILLHLRNHNLDLLRVFNNGADRGLQGFDVIFDKKPPPPEPLQFAYQIGGRSACLTSRFSIDVCSTRWPGESGIG